MSNPLLDRLLPILRVSITDVRAACRVGSRVYGTAGPNSDEDFVIVLSTLGQKQDLAFAEGINIVVHGVNTFQTALDDQSVFALECHFAPSEHVIVLPRPAFKYTLDRKKLAISATERSHADWQKGQKKFLDEPQASRKKLFHALRVPAFALQVARTGKLMDFTSANAWYRDIVQGPMDDFDWYAERFAKLRQDLCAELTKLGGKR
jgi:hypothetical protein